MDRNRFVLKGTVRETWRVFPSPAETKGCLCWVNGSLFSVGLKAAFESLLKVLQGPRTVLLSLTNPQGVPWMCPRMLCHPQPTPGDIAPTPGNSF